MIIKTSPREMDQKAQAGALPLMMAGERSGDEITPTLDEVEGRPLEPVFPTRWRRGIPFGLTTFAAEQRRGRVGIQKGGKGRGWHP